MKHCLRYSTAIAAVFTAQTAIAQEWDLDVHGYFNQHTGYASNDVDINSGSIFFKSKLKADGDYDEAVFFTDAEIHFTPSVTLDNGLTFGVNIQLEGNNNTPNIDESYLEIKSDRLGKLVLGSENSAGFIMMVAAPGVTSMKIDSPSVSQYVPFSGAFDGDLRQAGLASTTEVAGNNDPQRMTYYSPSFNGFMLGVSYAPTGYWKNDGEVNLGAWNNGVFDRKAALNDIIDVGLRYNQTWGETSLTVAGRYGKAWWGKEAPRDARIFEDPEDGDIPYGSYPKFDDPYTWGVGAQIGYKGFTFGGSYAKNNNGNDEGAILSTEEGSNVLLGDSTGWSLGATYDFVGPWSVEAVTYQGKYDHPFYPKKQKYQSYRIGGAVEMGPGVDFNLYGLYVKATDGTPKSQGGDRVKGWGIGSAINLAF